MNYLQTPIYSLKNPTTQAYQQHPKISQLTQNLQSFEVVTTKYHSKQMQTPKANSIHGNKLRPLIKINKNLQNAFPQNFFSASKPSTAKKHLPLYQKCPELNLQQIPSFSNNFHSLRKQTAKSQSIELKKPTVIDSSIICQNLDSLPKRLNIKAVHSLRTSIQKKQDITFSFEKGNEECLPQTAQTLENTEEDELFIVTFGNGFVKNSCQNGSSVCWQGSFEKQPTELKQKCSLRFKNAVSLELKRFEKSESMRTSRQNGRLQERESEKRTGSMSDRRETVCREFQQQRRKSPSQTRQENPFLKIRLDMDEILSKKTMFPRVNSQQSKRQRGSKLSKLVC